MFFDELNLNDNILDALYDMRFDECTPIQEACIPAILNKKDILGVAQTGTGKTAAYLLPVLSLLDDGGYPKDKINCIIMSPTRELAQQIDQAMQGFSYYLQEVSSVAVYGGNDGNRYDQEIKSLKLGADVIIATPGRLISHLSLGNIDTSGVSFFILDEADRMLDMGFYDDIMTIAKELPPHCQNIMFSATMPPKIETLARTILKNPETIKLAVSKPAEKIKQSAYVCYEPQKLKIVTSLFNANNLQRVIIFSGKKDKVKDINKALLSKKINSGAMHSDLSQAERDEVMFKFKAGQIDVLVATDIVSRGIDIDDIRMVLNYDVPHDVEDYIHRIGRTARADRDGEALTLISDEDMFYFQQIEKFLEKTIEKIPNPDNIGEGPEYKKILKFARKKGVKSRNASGKASFKQRQHKGNKPQQHGANTKNAHHSTKKSNENNMGKRPHKPVKKHNKPIGSKENTPQ
ncbi:MAG: DEAD/DEAH box helicase [Prevotella sp.]